MTDTTRRTIRRFAHELYPHADEGQTRDLATEVPYLYARAIGLEVHDTGWYDTEPAVSRARIVELVQHLQLAFLADALLQGLAGQEAWQWADQRSWDDGSEWAYERARHYGVPVELIKPYPCGLEPTTHDHMASTGDVTGYGTVTSIDCPESTCTICTVEVQPEEEAPTPAPEGLDLLTLKQSPDAIGTPTGDHLFRADREDVQRGGVA